MIATCRPSELHKSNEQCHHTDAKAVIAHHPLPTDRNRHPAAIDCRNHLSEPQVKTSCCAAPEGTQVPRQMVKPTRQPAKSPPGPQCTMHRTPTGLPGVTRSVQESAAARDALGQNILVPYHCYRCRCRHAPRGHASSCKRQPQIPCMPQACQQMALAPPATCAQSRSCSPHHSKPRHATSGGA